MTLDEYLTAENEKRTIAERQRITDAEFGAMVGLSQSQISRLRSGRFRPSWAAMEAIQKATGGEVAPNDWAQREAAE